MMATIEANWLIFAVVLVLGLLVAWWLFGRATSAPRQREHKPDVLDEGQAPAQRNQALIDAKPAAQLPPTIVPPPLSAAMGGLGEAIAIGAQDVVEEARAAEPAPIPEPEPIAAPPPAPEPVPPPAPAPVAQPVAKPIKAKSPPKSKAEPKPKALPKPKATPKSKTKPQPKPEPAPAPVAAPVPVQAPPPAPPPPPPPPPPAPEPVVAIAPDDLARIKGLGPKLQALLPELGLSTFAQIAALTEADLAELDSKLGPFAGRPARDSWVEQAKLLAAGDVAGFEDKFGKV
jgi:predicted flap endonuclease-1-like 5' DNA nuclease